MEETQMDQPTSNPGRKVSRDQRVCSRTAEYLGKRLLLLAALALGCAREPVEDLPGTVTPETARLVSTVTSGTVSPGDAVRVRFIEPAVDSSLAGHPLKKRVFTFTPPLDGMALWETTRELVFRPNRSLPARQQYRGRLDLAALLPRRPGLQPLDFAFIVAGREILSLEGDFDLKASDDPRYLVYGGRLELTEEAGLPEVREAVSLAPGRDPAEPGLGGGRGRQGFHLHQRRHPEGYDPAEFRADGRRRQTGDLPRVPKGDLPGPAAGDAAGEGREGKKRGITRG